MTAQASSILVVGGTGATGQLVVRQLLDRGHRVRIIVRSPEKIPEAVRSHQNATVIPGTALGMTNDELSRHIQGCDACISCLGHSLSWRGIFGPPWRLVANTASRLCRAAKPTDPDHPVRFVLMSSTGCRNRTLTERVSLLQRVAVRAIRTLLPPHADNEAAMARLSTEVGESVRWVIVRPDTLTNEDEVTAYETHASPIRSAVFNPGKTSRINAAHFMAELATDPAIWSRWAGQMPVVYNREAP